MANDSETRLNWVQVLAGAGAAVSSALLLSTLGVSGTIIGAAVGSVVASVASHTYSRGLAVSRDQALALRRLSEARQDIERLAANPDADQEAGLEHADSVLGRAEAELRRGRISWQHVALVAGGLFLGVMLAITGFELITGRALSSYTGGSDKETRTTVPGVEGSKKAKSTPTPTPSSTPSTTPTATPSSTPTVTPSESSTPSESPSLPTITLTPTESPSATP